MFRLLFELNRRMPNGTYGGVRGIINLYSIFKKIRDPQKGSFEPQRERRKVGRSFGGSGSIATNKMRGW